MKLQNLEKMGTLNQVGYHWLNLNYSDQSVGGLTTSASAATMMEKRQVFLRSYQFSRKMTMSEKMKRSLVKAKRVIWLKLRSAKKLRKVVWSRLRRFSLLCHRRRRFVRLRSHYTTNSSSNCFW